MSERVWTEEKALAYLKTMAAERGLTLHSVWRHWKTGHAYQVLFFSVDEATLAPMVNYQRVDSPEATVWSRKAEVFLENVKNGLDWTARFRREDA